MGGGIANTFIAAAGHGVGKSLHEPDMLRTAADLAAKGEGRAAIPLPVDVVVATEFSADADALTKAVDAVADDEMILDIGPRTAQRFAETIAQAGTVIWNGPVGVFEFDRFGEGTAVLAKAIAVRKLKLRTVWVVGSIQKAALSLGCRKALPLTSTRPPEVGVKVALLKKSSIVSADGWV